MIKRIMVGILLALMIFSLTACGKNIKIQNKTSTLEEVTVTLIKVSVKKNNLGATVFYPTVKITNDSDEGIMEVGYNLICLDKDGNELYTFTCSHNGENKAIAPGKSITNIMGGYQRVLDGEAAAMNIQLTELKTESEMPLDETSKSI